MPTLTLSGVTSDSTQWIFTWSTVSSPAGALAPIFTPNGTNAAQSTTVTISKAGNYTFACAVSAITAAITQVSTNILISPTSASVTVNGTQQFSATVSDQFGNQMNPQPTLTWSVQSGGGSVDSSGLYTAPGSGGSAVVKVATGSISATANVTINAVTTTTTTTSTTSTTTTTGTAPVLTTIQLFPATVSVGVGWKQVFMPYPKDQFGHLVTPAPAYTFSVDSGTGTIDTSGVYTAPASPGNAVVKVLSGSVSATSAVTVITPPAPGWYFNSGTGVLTIYGDTPLAHPSTKRTTVNISTLTISGTINLSLLVQAQDASASVLWSQQKFIPLSQVSALYYYGQETPETVLYNNTSIALTAFGGRGGFNQLTAGGGNDYLQGGGPGSYTALQGQAGDDVLVGGIGTNYLYGGGGNNTLVPGVGSNNLFPNG